VTCNDAQQQREVARAIKNAREMALLPYTTRVVSQRSPGRGDRDRDRDRVPRDEPPPRPSAPPPSPGAETRVPGDLDVEAPIEDGVPAAGNGDEANGGAANGDAAPAGDEEV
jgi:hypothetical protein